MPGWGQAIATTAGGAGNDYGRAVDANVDTALKVIQQKLLMQEVQQRIKEQDQRMKQQAAPQSEGIIQTPQGTPYQLNRNPLTGAVGASAVEGFPQGQVKALSGAETLGSESIESVVGKLPKDKQDAAKAMIPIWKAAGTPTTDIVKFLEQQISKETEPKTPKWDLRQDEKGNWMWIPASPDVGKPTPTGVKGKMPRGAGGGGGGGEGGDSVANWARDLAAGDATWSNIPAKLKTPVNNYMKQNGMTPKKKLNQVEQRQQDSINTLQPVIEDLENTLKSSGLVNPDDPSKSNNSPIASRIEWVKYNTLKMAPGGARGDLIRQSAALQVLGAAPWMTIGRSKYMYENIIKHLPGPEDSPKLLWDKAQFLKKLIADQQSTLDKAQGGSMGGDQPPFDPDSFLRQHGVIK